MYQCWFLSFDKRVKTLILGETGRWVYKELSLLSLQLFCKSNITPTFKAYSFKKEANNFFKCDTSTHLPEWIKLKERIAGR